MHMVAARLDCQSAMVGTAGCMDRLRKCYSHLVGGSILAGKAAWALSGCLTTKSAVTIAYSLMSGHGQGHESAYSGWKWTWVQFWSQSLDRNRDTVR